MQLDHHVYCIFNKNQIGIDLGELKREEISHSEYTKTEHLENFYKNRILKIFNFENDFSKLDLKHEMTLLIIMINVKKRYFILNKVYNLVFIPLTNKNKNIVDYGYIDLKDLCKIQDYGCYRYVNKRGGKYVKCNNMNKCYSLHEIIFGKKAETGNNIDHINSNGLDNRASNLREISFSENAANRKAKKNKYIF